jgi:hypothetical protein
LDQEFSVFRRQLNPVSEFELSDCGRAQTITQAVSGSAQLPVVSF